MLEKIKEMKSMKRVIFETMCAMICVSGVYIITFLFTGSVEISVIVAFATALTIAVVTFAAAAATVVTFAAAAVVAVATAAVVVDEYNVRYKNVLFLYLIEAALLTVSFLFFTPYLMTALLICCIIIASVIIGSCYLPEPIVKIIEPQEVYRGFKDEVFANPRYARLYNKFIKETQISEFCEDNNIAGVNAENA